MSLMGAHAIDILNAEQEQEVLTKQLFDASRAYYTGTPTMTDAEFDTALRYLVKLEETTGKVLPGSPTRQVGSDITGDLPKVKHRSKMLSLDNKFTADEVLSFFHPTDELTTEPKIDGCALKLEYDNGELQVAATRGDGTYGEDVTANARVIAGIPLVVSRKDKFEVRGEVVMTHSQLDKLNVQREAEGEAPFANCRNAASGSLKQKSPAECKKRGLNFISYWTTLTGFGDKHSWKVQGLDELGFHSIYSLFPERLIPSDTVAVSAGHRKEEVEDALQALDELRKTADIDLDGGVFKVNDTTRWAELGEGSKSPKWATAYKFPPDRAVTQLLDIQVTIGRTGQVTPLGVLSPVYLGGTTITRATLNNQDYIDKLGISIGDRVVIQRAAEVIPAIVGRVRQDGTWHLPFDQEIQGRSK
jgi:DNA ligase (NAD+)